MYPRANQSPQSISLTTKKLCDVAPREWCPPCLLVCLFVCLPHFKSQVWFLFFGLRDQVVNPFVPTIRSFSLAFSLFFSFVCCYKTRQSLLRLPPWARNKAPGSISTRATLPIFVLCLFACLSVSNPKIFAPRSKAACVCFFGFLFVMPPRS